jgi:hypothetical protein
MVRDTNEPLNLGMCNMVRDIHKHIYKLRVKFGLKVTVTDMATLNPTNLI